MVERCHIQLKDAMSEHLPWVLLGFRAAPKEDSGISSAEVLYGVPLTLPGQFMATEEPDVQQLVQKLRDVLVLAMRPTNMPPPEELPDALASAEFFLFRLAVPLHHWLLSTMGLTACRHVG